ncbi:MAG: type IV pilus biogenesis/stability protein PilW [Gammaproteobacteria bacterium]|nr:type IV pilus biogenesis/stability protein PilW [Gammaproteobacteria bacterium]
MRFTPLLLCFMAGTLLVSCASMEKSRQKNLRIAETHVQLGVGYFKQGKIDGALEKLKKALKAMPDYGPAHSTIALVYEQMEKLELAEEHYMTAMDLLPNDGGIQNNYGVFLCKQKKLQQAERYFLKAIRSPRYATPELAYENAGTCAWRIPDLEKAERYLRAALKYNPKLAISLFYMAKISFAQQNYLTSRAYIQRFEAVSPHNANSLWLGVRIERQLGDKTAEFSYAKQLQSKFPDSEEFKLLLNPTRGENHS